MAVYLPPMSSFERRLVHLALVDEAGVKSESEGEGDHRRVVVKPDK
jgi:spoIIIJ-associated protein